jgi:hypothetical protein
MTQKKHLLGMTLPEISESGKALHVPKFNAKPIADRM